MGDFLESYAIDATIRVIVHVVCVCFGWPGHRGEHSTDMLVVGVPSSGFLVVSLDFFVDLDIEVRHEEVFPLFVGTEPPAFLYCDI